MNLPNIFFVGIIFITIGVYFSEHSLKSFLSIFNLFCNFLLFLIILSNISFFTLPNTSFSIYLLLILSKRLFVSINFFI